MERHRGESVKKEEGLDLILHFRGRRTRTWEERVRISRDEKKGGPGNI